MNRAPAPTTFPSSRFLRLICSEQIKRESVRGEREGEREEGEEDYYKDIPRWSYNLETYFLAQRFKDVLEIARSQEVIIQDRTLFEGVHIFVANNYAMGNLSKRDYETYMDLYNVMAATVRKPDPLIYLKSSVPHLVAQIQKRGRDYEQTMSLEYLSGLNDRYDKWINEYDGKVLTIEADDLDFENRPEDFASITDRIDAELYGLFPLEK